MALKTQSTAEERAENREYKREATRTIKGLLVKARDPEAVRQQKPYQYMLVAIRQQIFDQLVLWKDEPGGNQWIIDLIKADHKAIEGLRKLGFEGAMLHWGVIQIDA